MVLPVFVFDKICSACYSASYQTLKSQNIFIIVTSLLVFWPLGSLGCVHWNVFFSNTVAVFSVVICLFCLAHTPDIMVCMAASAQTLVAVLLLPLLCVSTLYHVVYPHQVRLTLFKPHDWLGVGSFSWSHGFLSVKTWWNNLYDFYQPDTDNVLKFYLGKVLPQYMLLFYRPALPNH